MLVREWPGMLRGRALCLYITTVTGSRVRADFNLPLQRAFRIQGQLEGYKGSESVTFELLRGDEQVVPNRALLDGTTGRFEVLDVVPGAYTLLAAQGNTRGEIVVNVASADVGGTSITLTSPNVIHGSIHTIKSPTASSGSGEGYGADPADRCNVSLKDGRLQPGVDTPPYGRGSGDNQFDIENVYPGKYRVEFHCTGGYPVSASFGVVDLLANPIVTISAATARLPIEILFRPGGGTLYAKFAGLAPPEGSVLVVPQFSPSTGPERNMLRSACGNPRPGEAVFENLAPGDYLAYGFTTSDVEFRNPAFFQSLSGGASVHIEDGKTTEITIRDIFK
jgi:hypothetical protein